MLTVINQISETITHMVIPVAKQIVLRFIEELGCHDIFKNKIFYTGDFIASSHTSDEDNSPLLSGSRFNCAIDVNINPTEQRNDLKKDRDVSPHQYSISKIHNTIPFFYDHQTHTSLTLIEKPIGIQLTNVMKFQDRVTAYDAYSRFMQLYKNGIVTQDLAFTVPIPELIYTILYTIYTMNDGVPPEFINYLRDSSLNYISIDVNRFDNNKAELVLRHNTTKVTLELELSINKPEKIEVEQSSISYDITFDVFIVCQYADTIAMTYPIVVKNKEIPKNIVYRSDSESYASFMYMHKYFAANSYTKINMNLHHVDTIILPWYDQWKVPHTPLIEAKYSPFFQSIILLDNPDDEYGETIVDLTSDLDSLLLDPEILAILEEQKGFSLLMEDYINISVFANTSLVDSSMLSFDGRILTIKNRDIHKVYHLVISELDDDIHVYTQNRQIYFVNEKDENGIRVIAKYIVYPKGNIVKYSIKNI